MASAMPMRGLEGRAFRRCDRGPSHPLPRREPQRPLQTTKSGAPGRRAHL